MLSFLQVAIDDRSELGIGQQVPPQAVEGGGVARDAGREDHTARPEDAVRFTERRRAIVPLGQVVEGSKEQHRICGCVGDVQLSCVGDRC